MASEQEIGDWLTEFAVTIMELYKLGIVRKELFECLVWVRLLGRKAMVRPDLINPIRSE